MDDLGFHDALAMLDWQIELGADEALGDTPVDRFALADQAPAATVVASAPKARASVAAPPADDAPPAPSVDAVALAQAAASAAQDLPALHAAMEGFAHCPLRETATRLVFADGLVGARVMIVGEAPGRDEEQQGKPFVGQSGQLLDRMLAAIGLDRAAPDPAQAVDIANVVPWRPPQNRKPEADELAMMAPFMRRHIALAAPDLVVLMGNAACEALIGQTGITRLRGEWVTLDGRPAIPMLHPAYLLRRPQEKAAAWADLLSLKARLRTKT
ncbi:uracil-DNA glycosylase [Roseicyclus sp.]|uniref:uracil-DNA glycosylase n=1 Tax=Roseicyclus sp. TaxID=1914329 RepID=UPI003BB0B10D